MYLCVPHIFLSMLYKFVYRLEVMSHFAVSPEDWNVEEKACALINTTHSHFPLSPCSRGLTVGGLIAHNLC